ncbi:heparan sulfate 2-O-sulfotransferase 1-like [Scylla paramamosain]|uniref:heparan sulfate 2-O-sulfotransferase 1-like n=1 Tax=Scylla paramamosain TaxID=85552 RepID=UPI0030837011
MGRWRLLLRRWRNREETATLLGLVRYVPYIACVVALKVYVVMLLLHVHDAKQDYMDYNDYANYDDAPPRHKHPTTTTTTTTEEPGWREKQEVLSRLNTTTIHPSSTNRTPDTIWLFFNRIPRTAGQTLVSLMKSLGPDLNYQHQEHVYRTPWQRLMTEEEQRSLGTWFEYNFWPKSYDRFSMFINFTQHRSRYVTMRPAFVTLVRDPVEKYASYFRFKRVDIERVKLEMSARERKTPGSGRVWYWRKLDQCVAEGDLECDLRDGARDFTSAIPFLCGQHEQCLRVGDKWALQKAKYNAEFEYSVVGLTEHWNTTLAVLEHYLPLFFRGARQRYWSDEFASQRYLNKNPKKYKAIQDEVKKFLKERLALEFELYEFLQQRLHLQHQSLAEVLGRPTTLLPTKPSQVPMWGIWDRVQNDLARDI